MVLRQPHIVETSPLRRHRRLNGGGEHLTLRLAGKPRGQQEHPDPHPTTFQRRSAAGAGRSETAITGAAPMAPPAPPPPRPAAPRRPRRPPRPPRAPSA